MSDLEHYITVQGMKKLRDELDYLWKVERRKVTAEVTAAAALGDRSENAEYKYGKQRLREIDRRLRFLSKRMETLRVVEQAPQQRDRVFFGARVQLEDEDGEIQEYQIVGTDEFDADQGKVSVSSPMAKALLGKELDDEVTVQRPRGTAHFTITEIAYPDFEES